MSSVELRVYKTSIPDNHFIRQIGSKTNSYKKSLAMSVFLKNCFRKRPLQTITQFELSHMAINPLTYDLAMAQYFPSLSNCFFMPTSHHRKRDVTASFTAIESKKGLSLAKCFIYFRYQYIGLHRNQKKIGIGHQWL